MTKQFLFPFSVVLFVALFVSSCTEDPMGPDIDLPPSIRLLDGAGLISANTTAESGAVLAFQVSASAGDAPMDRFTIRENGSNVALGRLTFEAGSSFGANPALLISAADKQGFSQEIRIAGPTSPGNYEYEFEVLDEDGLESATSVTVSVELIPPVLTVTDTTSTYEVKSGASQVINVNATQGTAELATIGVYENEVLIDASRLSFDDNGMQTDFITNPEAVPGNTNFQTGISIGVSETPDSTPYIYRIELTDMEGVTASVSVEILVTESIDTSYTAVLVYNKDGQRLGGLNLYTGQAVAFNSSDAQIRDLGIDLNLPIANNWLQQIRAVNGAELRTPGNNQVEGFSFENTNSRDALVAAFESGAVVSSNISVAVGDVFLVKNNNDYFILLTTEISITPNDNNDYYEFSIKAALE